MAASTPQPKSYQWGQKHDDAITTTVAAPTAFTTGLAASPKSNAAAWRTEITFTNTTTQPFPLVVLQISAAVDGHSAEEVFDDGLQFDRPTLTPGQSVTISSGWIGKGSKYEVTVASADGSQAYTWSGQLGK
ncbi:hypothetical protein [Amycolatopsis sp. DSM 110486]|uniref:hypothetical protein n=1 Tax=Amycolatopsis sp. DSM 110486 TaxID=2865832 RepID=UPI001C694AAC|nr:hypothetical protein [Amycolatopsis sp. DSM 110486]QYN17577.1 hypothetical protein K1T34_32855 [Amycolatopsis sp. DSM 110486]